MKLSRPAGTSRWPRALSLALLAAVAVSYPAAPADGAPARSREAKAKPKAKKAAPVLKDAAAKEAPKPAVKAPAPPSLPEFADAYPSEFRPTPPDLLLKPEEERKAAAFAAFAQGLLAEDRADAEGMIEGYRKALEFDPGYTELAVKVAVDLARRNDAPAGIQILKDAIKAAPREPLPYIYLSQLYARFLKKPELAEKCAQDALTLAPENFAAHLALYELHIAAGDARKATQTLERAGRSNARDPKYWIQLGNLYQRLHLKDDGTCTPEEQQKMNIVHLKAAELGPQDAAVLREVGDYFVLSKQVKEAVPYYRTALALPPQPGDPPLANVRSKLARALLITGERDEAIGVLETLARDDALRLETYEMLGELYVQRSTAEEAAGDPEKAAASLQRALDNYQQGLLLDPSEPRNHVRLARLMARLKQGDKAVATMQAAKAKFPDLPGVTYHLAIMLSHAKRHTEALATFAEAQADAENSNEEMLDADFYFHYGAAAEQAGLTVRAAELLRQCLQLEPNSPEALNYLGYMWADRGEYLEEAGELIKKANEIAPGKGAYIDSLGWYYFKKGEPERALKELLRAAECIRREDKKDDPVVLDHIGDAYATLGKTSEALDYWKKAVALGLEDPKAASRAAEKIEEAKQKLAQGEAGTAETPPAAPGARN